MDFYSGVTEVARWCQVKPGVVSQWRRRNGGEWPVRPVVAIVSQRRATYGWDASQQGDWIAYARAHRRDGGPK